MAALSVRTPPLGERNVKYLPQQLNQLSKRPQRPAKSSLQPPHQQLPNSPSHAVRSPTASSAYASMLAHSNGPQAGPSTLPKRAGTSSTTLPSVSFRAAASCSLPPPRTIGKRSAEVVDLTCATGDVSEPSPERTTKKARLATLPPTKFQVATQGTSAIDPRKSSKARTREKTAQHEKFEAESVTWREKYKKAIPSFVFYFDALDASTEHSMISAVKRLGATVDTFFSKKVTHVVTSRPIPTTTATKENMNSPAFSALSSRSNNSNILTPKNVAFDTGIGAQRTQKQTSKPTPTSYSLLTGKKVRASGESSHRNPFVETQDVTPRADPQDILAKAAEFGLRVWRLEKCQRILQRINAQQSPAKTNLMPRTVSLPALLREEQVFGTRERDPFVLRDDTYYFPPNSYYVLVEDATGRHRPIATKEYSAPADEEDPEWPVLWGGVEGRGAFYHYMGPPIKYEAKPRLPVVHPVTLNEKEAVPSKDASENLPGIGTKPGYAVAAARALAPGLRRSVSLNQLKKQTAATGSRPAIIPPCIAGDGASAAEYIAASGNSQIITSNIASGTSTRSGATGVPGRGVVVDKRLAILNRSTVTTSRGPSKMGVHSYAEPAPGKLTRSMSVDEGLRQKVKPAAEIKETKKPGYCENCRIKYDDFKEHITTRKHRKFALNPLNWVELDILILDIRRPFNYEEADSGFYEGIEDEGVAHECSDPECGHAS